MVFEVQPPKLCSKRPGLPEQRSGVPVLLRAERIPRPGKETALRTSNVFNGYVAETLVQYRLLSFGFNVFPCTGQSEYDLIAEIGGIFVRIQVKSALPEKKRRGRARYNFLPTRGLKKVAYSDGEVDVFAFVARDLERVVFRVAHDTGKSAIHMMPEDFSKEIEKHSLEKAISDLLLSLR